MHVFCLQTLVFVSPRQRAGAVTTMLCGGFGGVAFWLAIFPADVIKSRVQVDVSGAQRQKRLSFIGTLSHIVKTEGK